MQMSLKKAGEAVGASEMTGSRWRGSAGGSDDARVERFVRTRAPRRSGAATSSSPGVVGAVRAAFSISEYSPEGAEAGSLTGPHRIGFGACCALSHTRISSC
jgi:hypothetical protein